MASKCWKQFRPRSILGHAWTLTDQLQHARLLVPFGTKDWSPDRVVISKDAKGEPVFKTPVSHVVLEIKKRQALRLNSDWYHLYERPAANTLLTASDRFQFVVGHMPMYCDVWDKFQQLFLSKYFTFIEQHVEENRPTLEQKLAGIKSLYSYQDWLLSAYLPVPQAIVYVPKDSSTETYADQDMLRVPLLFWTGEEALVLFFTGNDTPSPRRMSAQKKLHDKGYRILEVPQQDLIAEDQTGIETLLRTNFSTFWDAEILPSGTFRPEINDPKT